MNGKLSIVATPIGNLEDITLRALRTLKEANLILCEDTRVTKKLLSHFDIKTPTRSFHAHSGVEKYEGVAKHLREGKHIALVTDAGTPGVSDPGGELVSYVREHVEDTAIEAIPGPSALAAALSVSGLRSQQFVFYAFLPHKKGRETALKTIASDPRASVFFESTHRILKTLSWLATHLPPHRQVAVCKELTKAFEAVFVGTPADILARLSLPQKSRGEFVVVVEEE